MVAPALPEADYEASPDEPQMPSALTSELDGLVKWAESNKLAAKRDSLNFWMLKIPAIITSLAAGVVSHYHLSTLAIIVSAVSGVVILLDGIIKPGKQRGAHYLAHFEAMELQNTVVTKWKSEISKPDAVASTISGKLLDYINKERSRISGALKKIEANELR